MVMIMTKKSPKPTKQCEGCLLNRGKDCVAYAHPAEQWAHGDCMGYNNEDLMHHFGLVHDGQGIHARKLVRKNKAKAQKNIEHPEEHTKFKKITWP